MSLRMYSRALLCNHTTPMLARTCPPLSAEYCTAGTSYLTNQAFSISHVLLLRTSPFWYSQPSVNVHVHLPNLSETSLRGRANRSAFLHHALGCDSSTVRNMHTLDINLGDLRYALPTQDLYSDVHDSHPVLFLAHSAGSRRHPEQPPCIATLHRGCIMPTTNWL